MLFGSGILPSNFVKKEYEGDYYPNKSYPYCLCLPLKEI